jgi:Protein of unknown function (DUF3060)
MNIKSMTASIFIALLLGGCSGKNGPSISVNSSGGESAQVEISTDGVKVKADGEDGASDVTISGKGVTVKTDNGGESTNVNVSGDGIQVNVNEHVEPGSKPEQHLEFGVAGVEKNGRVNVDVGGVQIETDGSDGATNIQIGAGTVEIQPDQDVSLATDSKGGSKPLVITGASQDYKIDGEGREVVISGASNDVTITGNCLSVVVTGASNDVTLFSSAKIVVSGTSNDVIYQSGDPKIVNTGLNNTVEKG